MSKFWGSRFEADSDDLADAFSFSINYDYRLAKFDCLASIAHAHMLGETKIIPKTDAEKICASLEKIIIKIDTGKFIPDPQEEDIHSQIQTELKKLAGKAADRLHTARSRNDLIVTDMKMYCIYNQIALINDMAHLQKAIVKFAEENSDVMIPAYTHLQSAQVVLLAHHMLAYVEMIERDKERLLDSIERADVLPLGSCALSGTSLPIDRKLVQKNLGFQKIAPNSIDAVSDRDFIIESLSAMAIAATHFSRISEDFILWATTEFNYIDIDWSLCTGSSIMPHKKNPDILELIRGETGGVISRLNELLILVKGLPLTYNRDLQLDKPPIFTTFEKMGMMTNLLTKLFLTLKIKPENIDPNIQHEAFFSVDIMEYLIRKGVSYREAHDTVGVIVKECLDQGNSIQDLSATQLKKFHKKLGEDVKKLCNPTMSVKMKKSFGSTNPKLVRQQLNKWKKNLNV